MKISTKTKLRLAAATVATSAFFASTVAIETAKAATFTLTDEAAKKYGFAEKWELTAPNAGSVAFLYGNIRSAGDEAERVMGWEASYGRVGLELSLGLWMRDRLVGEYFLDGWVDGKNGDLIISLSVDGTETWVQTDRQDWTTFVEGNASGNATVPEPSSAIALGVLGAGLVASRLRRRSK